MIKQNKKKRLQGIPWHQLHNSGKVGIERTKFMNPVRSSGYKIINKEIRADIVELNYLKHEVYDYTYLDTDVDLDNLSDQEFIDYHEFKRVYQNKKRVKIEQLKKKPSTEIISFIQPCKRFTDSFKSQEIPENLFLEFASIPLTREGVLGFADKYGKLGFWRDNNYSDRSLSSFFDRNGESLMKWYHEIWHMRRVLKLWSCCWDKKELEKKEYVRFEVSDGKDSMYLNTKDDTYYENEDFTGEGIHSDEEVSDLVTQYIYPENERPPAGMNEKYFFAYADPHFGVSEHELKKEIDDYSVNKIKIIYLDHITNLINKFLEKRNFQFLTMAAVDMSEYKKISSNTNPGIENVRLLNRNILTPPDVKRKFHSHNLISELWCQCSEKISSNIRIKECQNCKKFFLEKRKDAKFCSESCRNKKYYEDKAWEELKLEIKKNKGLKEPIILKKVKNKYQIVEGLREYFVYIYFNSEDRNAKNWQKIPSQILKHSKDEPMVPFVSVNDSMNKAILGKELLIPLEKIDMTHATDMLIRTNMGSKKYV